MAHISTVYCRLRLLAKLYSEKLNPQ